MSFREVQQGLGLQHETEVKVLERISAGDVPREGSFKYYPKYSAVAVIRTRKLMTK